MLKGLKKLLTNKKMIYIIIIAVLVYLIYGKMQREQFSLSPAPAPVIIATPRFSELCRETCKGLVSSNGNFRVIFNENDGSIKVYRKNGSLVWSTLEHSKVNGPYTFVVQQYDGNFVVYDRLTNPVWAAGTDNMGRGPYVLIMQNDGNLVLYEQNAKARTSQYALWSSLRGRKSVAPKPATPVSTPAAAPKAIAQAPAFMTSPKATTPRAVTQAPATPRGTTSTSTSPRAVAQAPAFMTSPKATTPKATTPKATTPKATTPKATTPKATTPKATAQSTVQAAAFMPSPNITTTPKGMTSTSPRAMANTPITTTPKGMTNWWYQMQSP
jgi:hypothetical protein